MPAEQQSWWLRWSEWFRNRPLLLRSLTTAGVVVSFALIWWLIPPLLYRSVVGTDDARLTAVTTTRAALLAGFIGLGALGTFWLNSRVYQITARTFEVTERGHLTDRYTKAITLLGDDKIDVRLGGIYALEQIANDSTRDRDQATIVEVLSAFVRVHSDPVYRYKADPTEISKSSDDYRFASDDDRIGWVVADLKRMKPLVDVQAAVTVLGRLPPLKLVDRGDLPGAWLAHINLNGANLTGSDLSGANLTNALLGANLTRALLVGADLTGARLIGTDLSGANLTGARGLTQQQLDAALGNHETMLPPGQGLRRPERWLDGEAKPPG